MAPQPRILISGSRTDSKSVISAMAMVRAMGAEPMLVAAHAEQFKGQNQAQIEFAAGRLLAESNGVIVLGNDKDIDPAKYGRPRDPHTDVETDAARSMFEEALIKQALVREVPLLGICNGLQRLNVATGGTLIQHVPDVVGHAEHSQGEIPPYVPVQYVALTPGSTLSELAGDIKGVYTPSRQPLQPGIIMENSFHHQAVDTVGNGFRVAAVSLEPMIPGQKAQHIVEAIEADPNGPFKGQFIMGVQWHPEFGASDLGPKIFKGLVDAAKARQVSATDVTIDSISAESIQKLQTKFPAPVQGGMAAYVLNRRAQSAAGRSFP